MSQFLKRVSLAGGMISGLVLFILVAIRLIEDNFRPNPFASVGTPKVPVQQTVTWIPYAGAAPQYFLLTEVQFGDDAQFPLVSGRDLDGETVILSGGSIGVSRKH